MAKYLLLPSLLRTQKHNNSRCLFHIMVHSRMIRLISGVQRQFTAGPNWEWIWCSSCQKLIVYFLQENESNNALLLKPHVTTQPSFHSVTLRVQQQGCLLVWEITFGCTKNVTSFCHWALTLVSMSGRVGAEAMCMIVARPCRQAAVTPPYRMAPDDKRITTQKKTARKLFRKIVHENTCYFTEMVEGL